MTEKGKEAFSQYAILQQTEGLIMRQFARFFIKEEVSEETCFGDIRQEAFRTIIPKAELQEKIAGTDGKPLKAINFKWKAIDQRFHQLKRHLRPLMRTLDFSSTEPNNTWLTAITWLKRNL